MPWIAAAYLVNYTPLEQLGTSLLENFHESGYSFKYIFIYIYIYIYFFSYFVIVHYLNVTSAILSEVFEPSQYVLYIYIFNRCYALWGPGLIK